jgi:hypothetical protein
MSTPNYNEQSARDNPGTTYRRTRYFGSWNNPDATAQVQILEADAIFVGGKKRHLDESVGGLADSFSLADDQVLDAPFPILDPATNAPIPGAFGTRRELYKMMYAYNAMLRAQRDTAQQNQGQTP